MYSHLVFLSGIIFVFFSRGDISLLRIPESVGVTPGAQAAGVGVALVGADVTLDHIAGRPFLHLHALVTVCRDGVAAHQVAVASVLPVRPLERMQRMPDADKTELARW